MMKKINCIGIGTCLAGSRTTGRTQVTLEGLVEFARQVPDDPTENKKILIVGDPTGLSNSMEVLQIIQELQTRNIDIVFHTTQVSTIGRITGDELLEINKKYNHSYSGTFSDTDGNIKESLKRLLIIEPQQTVQENYSFNKKKSTPIKGRSSKKGKNNPQSGSNFHK